MSREDNAERWVTRAVLDAAGASPDRASLAQLVGLLVVEVAALTDRLGEVGGGSPVTPVDVFMEAHR